MPQRLLALDVFRGAAVALMILVNNPGSWAHLYPPLAHAPWHGLTPTDLVFPFFLFAVGNALALVQPRHEAGPAAAFWAKVAQRTLLIFAIGLALNISPLVRWTPEGELAWRSLDTLRVMGVLQRIALCFGAAAVISWALRRAPLRALPIAAGVLLLAYWAACLALGAPGDPYSLEGYFGTHWDRALLGPQHLYRGEGVPFDPEGLASTVPAVAQVLLGVWVGRQVLGAGLAAGGAAPVANLAALVARLAVQAVVLGLLAYAWQLVLPLNKKLWTPSYVLLSTSFAMLALAALLYALEGGAARAGSAAPTPRWARCFEVFGRNPLFIFVLAGLVPRVLALVRWPDGVDAAGQLQWISPWGWAWRELFMPLGQALAGDPRLGSLLQAGVYLGLYGALAAWMDRRRLYIRV